MTSETPRTVFDYLKKWKIDSPQEYFIPEQYKEFVSHLTIFSPSLANRVSKLLSELLLEKSEITLADQIWQQNFEKIKATFDNMGKFFKSFSDYYHDEEISKFLDSWYMTLCFSLAQTLTILTIFHDHLDFEPCNFVIGFLPCQFPKKRKMNNINQVYGEILSLYRNQKNIFNVSFPQGESTIKCFKAEKISSMVYIPSCLTIDNLAKYIDLMDKFWQILSYSNFGAKWRQDAKNEKVFLLDITPQATLKINLDQARRQINLKGKGDFEGISFRVDQESNGQLSIDFGGDTNYATLIQISQLISKIPVHESYFKPPKAGMLYNLTEEKGLKLSNNQLIALVNAFGFQLFSLLESPHFNGLDKYQSFSYHVRPQSLQSFSERYGEILEKIKNK